MSLTESNCFDNEIRRFEFRKGEVYEIESLLYRRGRFHQSRENFREYCSGLSSYLNRLSNPHKNPDRNCPFCAFSFNEKKKAYINPNRPHYFVGELNQHREMWDEGLIVTSNRNGWHLINELLIPRAHVTEMDEIIAKSKSILSKGFSRWHEHEAFLQDILASDELNSLYHGITMNHRIGQSVEHAHYHCYSTLHSLTAKNHYKQATKVARIDSTVPFEVRVVPSDHPNLFASAKLEEAGFDGLNKHLDELIKIFKASWRTLKELHGTVVPISFGLFLIPQTTPQLLFFLVPMKRHGTLQAFQGGKFTKFRPNVIVSNTLEILADKLTKQEVDFMKMF